MSWLRTAVSKAVEVGKNKNNITRTVKNYADSVVQQAGQAVAGGAKIFQDRVGARNYKSFKLAVKRLEEAAVNCRGAERSQLLRRWLILLKEIEKISEGSSEDEVKTLGQHLASDETKGTTRKASVVLYYDADDQTEPMNFRDLFLYSQALEGIVLSMILQAPNDEEVSLLLQMFELCLTGGKGVHNAIVSSVLDLANAFSGYEDEVLVKREELLQFAQGAISGLKINADIKRIDAEAANLQKKLNEIRASWELPDEDPGKPPMETAAEIEVLKEALAHIRICYRLEGILLKKMLLHYGDTPEVHAQKVDKLKVLSASLSNSFAKAEKRIYDARFQREEALKFRVTKESEISEIEKEIAAEIAGLEKQRDELEAQLKKVNISLAAAHKRLHNTREEKAQFDEANNQIMAHLKTKEDDLSRSIGSCSVEADVLKTWVNFLEDTWSLQCSYIEEKEKGVNDELERHEEYFVKLAIDLLSHYKKKLEPSISRIRIFVENLKTLNEGSEMVSKGENEHGKISNPRKNLEEEYLDYEAKIITTFSVVDNMKEQFYAQQEKIPRKNDPEVRELFDSMEKLRQEFESIERPALEMESPTGVSEMTAMSEKSREIPSETFTHDAELPKAEKDDHLDSAAVTVEQVLDPESELAKLESEFGKVSQQYTTEEIGCWEFDELEREFTSHDSATST
ncbi:hypothetical protein Nepgr_013581 [Nepenthes gracilis]|uniref:Uncharacterized protein n=1 Tax=Nepenthes gracilis TaxID=150966 RepID=A0AAD3SJ36_NEPGR|nr:hypothetical protein Nepgr_013581 [Nepenthes gracilis]